VFLECDSPKMLGAGGVAKEGRKKGREEVATSLVFYVQICGRKQAGR